MLFTEIGQFTLNGYTANLFQMPDGSYQFQVRKDKSLLKAVIYEYQFKATSDFQHAITEICNSTVEGYDVKF